MEGLDVRCFFVTEERDELYHCIDTRCEDMLLAGEMYSYSLLLPQSSLFLSLSYLSLSLSSLSPSLSVYPLSLLCSVECLPILIKVLPQGRSDRDSILHTASRLWTSPSLPPHPSTSSSNNIRHMLSHTTDSLFVSSHSPSPTSSFLPLLLPLSLISPISPLPSLTSHLHPLLSSSSSLLILTLPLFPTPSSLCSPCRSLGGGQRPVAQPSSQP